MGDAPDDGDGAGDDEVVVVELTDELDLHAFRPSDVKELVPDYLEEAWARGWEEVRIVHGKGTGVLRATVHAILDRHPRVASYRLAGDGRGGWGATIVTLRR